MRHQSSGPSEAALCPGEVHEHLAGMLTDTGRPVVKGAVASFRFCTVKAWSQNHRASDIREKQLFQAGEIAPFAKDLVCKHEDLSSDSNTQIKSHM